MRQRVVEHAQESESFRVVSARLAEPALAPVPGRGERMAACHFPLDRRENAGAPARGVEAMP